MLNVGDFIEYNAGKASGRILVIKNNGRHISYTISNGDVLLDLDKKVGKPGGVKVIGGPPPGFLDRKDNRPVDLIGGGFEIIKDDKAVEMYKGLQDLGKKLSGGPDTNISIPTPEPDDPIQAVSGVTKMPVSPSHISPSGV